MTIDGSSVEQGNSIKSVIGIEEKSKEKLERRIDPGQSVMIVGDQLSSLYPTITLDGEIRIGETDFSILQKRRLQRMCQEEKADFVENIQRLKTSGHETEHEVVTSKIYPYVVTDRGFDEEGTPYERTQYGETATHIDREIFRTYITTSKGKLQFVIIERCILNNATNLIAFDAFKESGFKGRKFRYQHLQTSLYTPWNEDFRSQEGNERIYRNKDKQGRRDWDTLYWKTKIIDSHIRTKEHK